MVLVLCEMLSVSSRVWTRVAVSIYYDNNHNTTGISYVQTIIEEYHWYFSSPISYLFD